MTYIDYYSSNNISPVSQNIKDLRVHFQRRESLLLALKIIPSFLKDKEILEFGPGSGHNSLYFAHLSPKLYELVEGNALGAKETKKKLKSHKINIKISQCLFEQYSSTKLFDLVWAEGCIPHQNDPIKTLKVISKYVEDQGVLAISTVSGISYLSETFRRLFKTRFFQSTESVVTQAKKLKPFYITHVKNLSKMSRPIEDWILDSILQDLQNRNVLGIPEAINFLKSQYDVLGSSPQFITDWRWYKEIVGDERNFNDKALENYYKNTLNFIDYRFVFPQHSISFGKNLDNMGIMSWELMCNIQKGNETCWLEFFTLMKELISLLNKKAPATCTAIKEAVELLQFGKPENELHHFPKWWGRGQQYLSFIKK